MNPFMRLIHPLATTALLVLTAGLLCGQDSTPASPWPETHKPSQTDANSRKLIDLHLKARGGQDALAEVRQIVIEGTLTDGQETFRIEQTHLRPSALREEVYRTHVGRDYRTVRGTTGDTVWQQVVLPDKKLPHPLNGTEADLFDLEARIPFLFLDWEEQGLIFQYQGESPYAGQPAYVLHGWLPSGLQLDVFLDARTFHILNYRHAYPIAGQPVMVDRTPVGLIKVDGVWWERGYKLHIRGKDFRSKAYQSVQTIVPADLRFFSEPPTNERWIRRPLNPQSGLPSAGS